MRALNCIGGAMVLLTATVSQAVVIVDAPLTNTSQVRTASNNPFFGAFTENLAGISLFYQAGSASGPADSVNGVFFDNVQFPVGGVPPVGPLALTRNGSAKSLTVNAPWGALDANPRFQNAGTVGPDAANLNLVTNEYPYIGGGHPTLGLNFGNLGANRNVYVQLIGGDQGWNGDIGVVANGNPAGTWTTVADVNSNTASIFGFTATTNAGGNLNLDMNIVAGNFAGVAGVVILGETALSQAALTNTSQITTLGRTLAAVDLWYPQAPSQQPLAAPGTVNGIPFQNIAFDNGAPQALTNGGTVTLSPVYFTREREQATAGTISGPNDFVLESIANSINYLQPNEQLAANFAGLPANTRVQVQVIGGDAGTTFNNWLGDIEITANGGLIGLWDTIADDDLTTASLATFFAMTDATGQLNLIFRQTQPFPSPFAGIAGIAITAQPIPEPATVGLLGVAGLALLRRRRHA